MNLDLNNNLNLHKIATYRHSMQLNQTAFWRLFGCTQSAGCRYESGREIPEPVVLLLILRAQGKITDDDLKRANDFLDAQKTQ